MKFVRHGLGLALAISLVWAAPPPDPRAERYVKFGRYTNEIRSIFHTRTIERRLLFTIDVDKSYFDSLFGNLPYAVDMAVAHAGKKYEIKAVGDHYDAFDGLKTKAQIFEFERNLPQGSLSFFVKGTYKGSLTVNGSLVMDVKYHQMGPNTHFFITTYISIDDPFLREMAQFLSNFKSFRDFTDRLVEGTIGEIRRVGFVTARALKAQGPAKPAPDKAPGLTVP